MYDGGGSEGMGTIELGDPEIDSEGTDTATTFLEGVALWRDPLPELDEVRLRLFVF